MADDGVEQFTSVTGASKEQAAFYLDSAGGNVEAAIDSFFNTGGGEAHEQDGEGNMMDDERPSDAPLASVPSTGAIKQRHACSPFRHDCLGSGGGSPPLLLYTASRFILHTDLMCDTPPMTRLNGPRWQRYDALVIGRCADMHVSQVIGASQHSSTPVQRLRAAPHQQPQWVLLLAPLPAPRVLAPSAACPPQTAPQDVGRRRGPATCAAWGTWQPRRRMTTQRRTATRRMNSTRVAPRGVHFPLSSLSPLYQNAFVALQLKLLTRHAMRRFALIGLAQVTVHLKPHWRDLSGRFAAVARS